MTTCDPSRRPAVADQKAVLAAFREFLTRGSTGPGGDVHNDALAALAADAACPACTAMAAAELGLPPAAAISGEAYVSSELAALLLALVDATEPTSTPCGTQRSGRSAYWPAGVGRQACGLTLMAADPCRTAPRCLAPAAVAGPAHRSRCGNSTLPAEGPRP